MLEPSTMSASFSFWNLFWQADWIVKSVILGLLGSSIWSWAIIFSKIFQIRTLNAESKEALLWIKEGKSESLEHRFSSQGPFFHLIQITSQELNKIRKSTTSDHTNLALERLNHLLTVRMDDEREELSRHMGVLASMGSTAPFIGLFGTVWGIMNSFQGIALNKNASLAVVAPGISEALFATAIGLVVAIPAVIAYNRLSLAIQSYGVKMENFSQQLLIYGARG